MYRVKLQLFEGPMELLLFLIRRNEIDIYDIPMANLTRQFLEHMELMERISLEVSADFIEMAATLMKIKSRMLLPAVEADNEGAAEDPRNELVYNLLEYEKFSRIARRMQTLEEKRRLIAYGGAPASATDFPLEEKKLDLSPANIVKLFEWLIGKFENLPVIIIPVLKVTTRQKMELIRTILKAKNRIRFSRFFEMNYPRIEIVACFLALLELGRLGELSFRQQSTEGDIFIFRKNKHLDMASGGGVGANR